MSRTKTCEPDLLELLCTDTPLLDVRAEVEFNKGKLPHSVNLPILNTEERHRVGTAYKRMGSQAAVELGHQLVSGEVREQRIKAWADFVEQHPNCQLFCWRGGKRSHIAQQWLAEKGIDVPLIEGGYKALRRSLIANAERLIAQRQLLLIGGKTGSAKTTLLNQLSTGIDLEGCAQHRGSSFGRKVGNPPAQASFENSLFIEFARKSQGLDNGPLFLEDESHRIGAVSIPNSLFAAMKQAPIAVLEVDFTTRVDNIAREYTVEMRDEYNRHFPEDGDQRFKRYLLDSLERIRKRLGRERYETLKRIMEQALEKHIEMGDNLSHHYWITQLLADYYDPMYLKQLELHKDRIIFKGNYAEILDWARQQYS